MSKSNTVEPRISKEDAERTRGEDEFSPLFDIVPKTGNTLHTRENVRQLARLKHADTSRFLDLIDVLADRGVRQLPELQKKVDRYLARQAKATRKKTAVAIRPIRESEESTEAYFGEVTITKGGDVANGKAFAQRYKGHLLYVDAAEEWRRFNGNHWQRCSRSNIDSAAKACLRVIVNRCAEALQQEPDDKRAKDDLLKALHANDRLYKVRAMAEAGRSERGMFVNEPDRFDSDIWLLGVRNGVIDLRTGKLLEAGPGAVDL